MEMLVATGIIGAPESLASKFFDHAMVLRLFQTKIDVQTDSPSRHAEV
mgnify:CR=1 FL=1|jgi:hypothetical protein